MPSFRGGLEECLERFEDGLLSAAPSSGDVASSAMWKNDVLMVRLRMKEDLRQHGIGGLEIERKHNLERLIPESKSTCKRNRRNRT